MGYDSANNVALFNGSTMLCSCTACSGAGEEGSPWGVVVDGNTVYALWEDSGVNFFKCPKGGGSAVVLYQNPAGTSCALVNTSTALYWKSDASGGLVYRLVK